MTADALKLRRLPRFSLRSLILFVALAGSGYGLWVRWEPWVVVNVLEGHSGSVLFAAFSPEGKRIVTASSDRTARVWDVTTEKTLATLKGHSDWVNLAAFSPDGNLVATSALDDSVVIWDRNSGDRIYTLYGHGALPNLPRFQRSSILLYNCSPK